LGSTALDRGGVVLLLDISDLLREVGSNKHVDFQASISVPNDEVEVVGPVRVSLDLFNTGKAIIGAFQVDGTLRGSCARCLAEARVPLKISFQEEFSSTDHDQGERVFAYHDDVLDPSEAIRQNVILAIPPKILCGPECRGLCPRCGADLNAGPCGCKPEEVDDRWAPLRKLLERPESGQGG
jgi:uncharacterized protein